MQPSWTPTQTRELTTSAARIFAPATITSGKAFVVMDSLLDNAMTGPRHLANPEIAALVARALRDGERKFDRYQLLSFVVMPNPVHLLVTPKVPSAKWLGPLKGFTAHEANRMLGLTDKPFWQNQSHDHVVRSPDEFNRIRGYIENNPVKAGIVASPEDFPWSSVQACLKQAAG